MGVLREKVIKYGTFLIVGVTPILYLGSSWYLPHVTPKTFFFYGGVEIIFALWLYTLAIDRSYRLDKKTLLFFVPIIGYVLWVTIAGLRAVRPEMAFWSSLERATGLLTLYHVLALLFVITSLL